MWSCGAVLYAMLSGFPPYLGDGVDDTLDRIADGDGATFAHEEWDEVRKTEGDRNR